MAQEIINIGTAAGAGDGDDLYTAFDKVNSNFTEIYSGNVLVAGNVVVYSVAGRVGNVVLTVQDVLGAASYSNIAILQNVIEAANIAARNYADAAISNLGPLPNVEITGGTISGVYISNSYALLSNIAVSSNATISGQVSIGTNLGVGQNIAVGGYIAFTDGSTQTTAFPGFGNIFANAGTQAASITAINANVTAANARISALLGNLTITDRTISGSEIILEPTGSGNVYVGAPGEPTRLLISNSIVFPDNSVQTTAYTAGEFVTDAELSSNVTILGTRIDAANAAIATNTNRVAAANSAIASLTATVGAQGISDAANVAAANASINTLSNRISAANAVISSTNANVAAANAAISSTNANVAAANSAIASLTSTVSSIDPVLIDDRLNAANVAILTNTNRVAAANASISSLRSNVTAANAQITSLQANVAAANAAISAVNAAAINANVAAANAEILALGFRISAANGSISSTNANVAAANAAIASINVNGINANVAAANATILQLDQTLDSALVSIASNALITTGKVDAANVEINKLRANVTAANTQITSLQANVAAANLAIAALGAIDVNAFNANLNAANATILSNTIKISAANAAIAGLRANITAANAAIGSLSSSLTSTDANVAAANAAITVVQNGLNAANVNIVAANSRISLLQNTLTSNAAAQAVDIVGLRANITAANVVIDSFAGDISTLQSNAATQSAQLFALSANTISQQAAIDARATLSGAAFTGNVSTTANLSVTGNVSAGNVSAAQGTFTRVAGELITAAQPNVTSLGTLTGLTVDGNIQARYINSTLGIFGQLLTSSQPFITTLGTLGDLTVAANASMATLEVIEVNVANQLTANTVTSVILTGLLTTPYQPSITGIGTLSNLRVTGDSAFGNLYLNGSIVSNTGATSFQLNSVIANVGNIIQTNTVSGNILNMTGDTIDVTGNINSSGNLTVFYTATADSVVANLITGTLTTALQPNITTVGTLVSLDVTGNVISTGNISATGNVSAEYFVGNAIEVANATIRNNLYTGNIDAANMIGTIRTATQPFITTVGNLVSLNVDTDLTVSGNLILTSTFADISAGVGTYVDVFGNIKTNAQPFITSVGTLTGLDVTGEVSVTGNAYVSADMYVNGNLYIAGNNTVVNAEIVTTEEKNFVLANGVISSTLAAGAGLLIGDAAGIYGNLTIYEGVWATPNDFAIGGNLSAGNTTVANITSVGVVAADSATIVNDLYAGSGSITGNVTTGNVSGYKGTFTELEGTVITSAQPNITSVGNLSSLEVSTTITVGTVIFQDGTQQDTTANNAVASNLAIINANVAAANAAIAVLDANLGTATTNITTIDANLGVAVTDISTLFSNAATQATEISDLQANVAAANVEIDNLRSNITAANVEIGSLQSNIAAANVFITQNSSDIANITVILGGLAVNVDPVFGGNLRADDLFANANLSAGGAAITFWTQDGGNTALINTRGSNLVISTATTEGNVVIQDNLDVAGNIASGNISGTQATFVSYQGTLITEAQPNITSVGTLISLDVTGNIVTGNISGSQVTIDFVQANSISVLGLDVTTQANILELDVDGNVVTNALTVETVANINDATVSNLVVTTSAELNAPTTVSADISSSANVTLEGNLTAGNIIANVGFFAPSATFDTINLGDNITTVNLFITGNSVTANANIANAEITTALVTSVINSTSTDTGAVVVLGGVGIAQDVWIGGTANVGANVMTGNLSVDNEAIFTGRVLFQYPTIETTQTSIGLFNEYAETIIIGNEADSMFLGANAAGGPYGAGNVYIKNSLNVFGNIVANANVSIQSTDESVSAQDGALVVTGGAGIGSNLHVGANTYVMGNAIVSQTGWFGANVYFGANTETFGNVYANNIVVTYDISARRIDIEEGIVIPELDETPIGQNSPAAGGFTEVKFDTLVPRFPRPTQRPTLMIDFANNPEIDSRMTYSRNSAATYLDYTGNLVVAAVDQPRWHHDGASLSPRGILLEEQRQNLYTHSQDFANVTGWQTVGGTVSTTNATTAPSGVLGDAHELVENTSAGLHGIATSANNQPALTSTAYYTASVFAKAGARTQLSIIFFGEGSAPIFDFVTGGIYQEGGLYSSQVEEFSNGWYRFMTTIQKTNTSGNVVIALADGGTNEYTGTGAVGAYVYGFQVEADRGPSSYIPTTSDAPVTRAADLLNMPTESWYSGQEGTLFVDAQIGYIPTTKLTNQLRPTLVSLEGPSANTRVSILAETLNTPVAYRSANLVVYNNNQLVANIGSQTAVYFNTILNGKVAAYFKSNAFALTTNGNIPVSTSTVGAMPQGQITNMLIGSGTGTNALNGTISKIMYFPRKASSTDNLVGLTEQ
jgi:predicted  nucleic acid-binding Zn-ribbon protein